MIASPQIAHALAYVERDLYDLRRQGCASQLAKTRLPDLQLRLEDLRSRDGNPYGANVSGSDKTIQLVDYRTLARDVQSKLDGARTPTELQAAIEEMSAATYGQRGYRNGWHRTLQTAVQYVDFITPLHRVGAKPGPEWQRIHEQLVSLYGFRWEQYQSISQNPDKNIDAQALWALRLTLAHDDPARLRNELLQLTKSSHFFLRELGEDDFSILPFSASAEAALRSLPASELTALRQTLTKRAARARLRAKFWERLTPKKRDAVTGDTKEPGLFGALWEKVGTADRRSRAAYVRRNSEVALNVVGLGETRALAGKLATVGSRAELVRLMDEYYLKVNGQASRVSFDSVLKTAFAIKSFVATQGEGRELLWVGSEPNGRVHKVKSDRDLIPDPVWGEALANDFETNHNDMSHVDLGQPKTASARAFVAAVADLQGRIGDLPISIVRSDGIEKKSSEMGVTPTDYQSRYFGGINQAISFLITGNAVILQVFDLRENRVQAFDVTPVATR